MNALCFSLVLLALMTLSRAYVFQQLSSISTGRMDLFNLQTFSSPSSIPYNYTTTFSSVMSSVSQVGVSLISFSGLISMDFAYNLTVLSFTTSSIQVSAVTYNKTYLTSLSVHFIASGFNYLDIQSGCFFCSGLNSGQGTRSQSFSNLISAFTLSATNPLLITTVLSGLSIHNPNGARHQMGVSSSIASGSSLINLTVTAYELNQLQYVCVIVLVYEAVQSTAGYINYKQTNTISSNGLFSFLPYPPIFQIANVMFFGFSYLDVLFSPVPTKTLTINTNNFTDISSGFTATPSINEMKLEQFFLIWTNCATFPGLFFYYGNYTCTSGIPDGTTANALGVCVPCNLYCPTCNGINANNCLSCNSASPVYRSLNTSTCDCLNGYVDNGVLNCELCSATLTSLCLSCSTNTTCIACASPFVPVNGVCECPSGLYFIFGNCTSLIGCTNIVPITSGPYCTSCNKTMGFQLMVNQTCGCIAGTVLVPNNTQCVGVCQDGYHLNGEQCDMGPYVAGNGCAPDCTILPNFFCSDSIPGGKSICVPKMTFFASYIYAERVVELNSAILYFKISPPHQILTHMNFNQTVLFSFPNSDISCTYDLATSLLTATVAYSESIEGANVFATIKFDNFVVNAPPITVKFASIGVNYELSFDENLSINSALNLIANLIGILSVVVALIATLLGHKLLGFELMLSVQAIYFSTVCLSSPTVQLYSMQGLQYSTGYNVIASFSLSQNYDMLSGLITVGNEKDFLMNFNYMAIPLVLSSVLLVILNMVMKSRGKDSQQLKSSQPFVADTPLEHIYVVLLDKIFPFVVALTLSRVVFSYVVQFAKKNSSTMVVDSFQSGGFASMCVLILMQSLYFLYRQCRKRASPLIFEGASKRYAIVLLMEYLAINCILSMLFFIEISIYIALLLSIVPTIVNIYMRPYGKLLSMSSFASLLCSFGFFFAILCMAIIGKHCSEILILILLIADLSILFFAEIFILVIVIYMNYCSKKEKAKPEEIDPVKAAMDKDNAIATAAIKESLLFMEGKSAIIWEHASVKKNIQMEDSARDLGGNFMKEDDGCDDDELTRLKLRLKQEMKEKKMGVRIKRTGDS